MTSKGITIKKTNRNQLKELQNYPGEPIPHIIERLLTKHKGELNGKS